MKYLIPLVFLLSGCAGIAERGREAADETHRTVEYLMCIGGSRGGLMRDYAISAERWDAWMTLCGHKGRDLPRPILSE